MSTVTIDSEKIKLPVLGSDVDSPEEGDMWFKGATEHGPRFHNGTEIKNVGDIRETEVDGKITTHAGITDAHHVKTGNNEVSGLLEQGVVASRPAASIDGRLYYATDEDILYRDNGTTWEERARGETATRLAQLSEKAHGSLTGIAEDDHHAKYTDAEAEIAVEAAVEVGDLKTPTGPLAMNGQAISGLPAPSAGSDACTRDYADDKVQGLDWQASVLDELADPPGTPTTGDRYLVIATATGDWVGHEDDIAEWDGSAWDFITPNKGFAVWIEDVGTQKNYNGTAWVAFGSTVDHGNLTNVTANQHHAQAHDHTGETLNPAVINVGDIGFKNGWILTEDDQHGLVWITPKGHRYRAVGGRIR